MPSVLPILCFASLSTQYLLSLILSMGLFSWLFVHDIYNMYAHSSCGETVIKDQFRNEWRSSFRPPNEKFFIWQNSHYMWVVIMILNVVICINSLNKVKIGSGNVQILIFTFVVCTWKVCVLNFPDRLLIRIIELSNYFLDCCLFIIYMIIICPQLIQCGDQQRAGLNEGANMCE